MSLHGKTSGTQFEALVDRLAQGEAKGAMLYQALARLALEQGLEDVAAVFVEAAQQEAVHAGFYATLNGRYPQDFWTLVRGLMAAEKGGEASVNALSEKFAAAGLQEAAAELQIFARQEGHHGKLLGELLEKYHPELLDPSGRTVFVCPVCGFEYLGDLTAEGEDYVCPVCGQPRQVFRRQH